MRRFTRGVPGSPESDSQGSLEQGQSSQASSPQTPPRAPAPSPASSQRILVPSLDLPPPALDPAPAVVEEPLHMIPRGSIHNSLLSPADLSTLHTDEICTFCQVPLQEEGESPVVRSPCDHHWHSDCINRQIEFQMSLPGSRVRCPNCGRRWNVRFLGHLDLSPVTRGLERWLERMLQSALLDGSPLLTVPPSVRRQSQPRASEDLGLLVPGELEMLTRLEELEQQRQAAFNDLPPLSMQPTIRRQRRPSEGSADMDFEIAIIYFILLAGLLQAALYPTWSRLSRGN